MRWFKISRLNAPWLLVAHSSSISSKINRTPRRLLQFSKTSYCLLIINIILLFLVISKAEVYAQDDNCVSSGSCLEAADETPLNGKTPLILVHGWNPEGLPAPPQKDAWTNFINYYQATPSLHDEYKLYLFSYYSNALHLSELGRDLRDTIDKESLADPTGFGAKPISIVAHSLGGLISRYFMKLNLSQGAFAGMKGGDRVIKLITLGTPHHGSPLANGPAWQEKIQPFKPGIITLCGLIDILKDYYLPEYDTSNRSDLWWDNYDNLLDYATYPEENIIIKLLNSDPTYDNKIIVYGGVITDHDDILYNCSGGQFLGVIVSLRSNDGIVPFRSAVFENHTVHETRIFPGFNHEAMRTDDGNGSLSVFDSIKIDLSAANEPLSFLPPTISSPGTDTDTSFQVSNLTPDFVWSSVDGVTNYGLYISKYPYGPANLVYSGIALSGTSYFIPDGYLVAGGKYRWQMTSLVDGAESDPSPLLYFETPYAADSPVIASPGTDSDTWFTVSNLTPVFSWDAVGGADRYGIYISKYPYGTANIIYSNTSLAGTSFTLPSGTIVEGEKYRWNMTSFSGNIESVVSNTLYFQTNNASATYSDSVVIVSPGTDSDTGFTVSNNNLVFSWNEVVGEDCYVLYISKDPYGAENMRFMHSCLTGTSFTLPDGVLVEGEKYSWNMSASIEGAVSDTLHFQTSGTLAIYTISTSASPLAGGNITAGGDFEDGSCVTVVATPNPGYNFVNWEEGSNTVSTSETYGFRVSGPRILIANFVPSTEFTINVSAVNGSILKYPDQNNYSADSQISLIAIPDIGYQFKEWSGACSGKGACNLTMTSNMSVMATFTQVVDPPSAPTGTSATDGAYTDKIRITWEAASGATGYEVWRSLEANPATATRIAQTTSLSYDDTSAPAETQFWYYVRAYIDSSIGDFDFPNRGYRASPPPNDAWVLYAIDKGHNGADGLGIFPEVVVDSSNNVHVVYFMWDGKIWYATDTTGGWRRELIGEPGRASYPLTPVNPLSLTIDSSDHIHISYRNNITEDLVYMTNTSGSWQFENVDTENFVGAYSSIAVDLAGYMHISYQDETNHSLKYATNKSGNWVATTVDNNGWVGYGTSIALDSESGVHISYATSVDEKQLRYASNISGFWNISVVDGNVAGGCTNSLPAITIDSVDNAHIAYKNHDGNLLYATNASGSWQSTTIDGSGVVKSKTSMAVDGNDQLHIAYIVGSTLAYATNSSGSWSTFNFADGNSNNYPAIITDSNGGVHINFMQDTGDGDLFYYTNAAALTTLHTLSVVREGTGSGIVTSDPAGIYCGTDCDEQFLIGTGPITLTATPDEGSTFMGWGGACTGVDNCSIMLDAIKEVTATFAQTTNFYTLTVNTNGSGIITSEPGGIDCGIDCTEVFSDDDSVNLLISANSGWYISDLIFESSVPNDSPGACEQLWMLNSTIGNKAQTTSFSCQPTMDRERSVTAVFSEKDPISPGDINGNGIIELQDAILAIQAASNATPAGSIKIEADVNGDNKIGIEDAVYILQSISEIRPQ